MNEQDDPRSLQGSDDRWSGFEPDAPIAAVEVPSGVILAASPSAVSALGLDEDQLVGRLVREFVTHPTDQPANLPEDLQVAAARLAHDLRGHLSSIAGFADLLLRDGGMIDETRRHHMLERISANAHLMADMCNTLAAPRNE